MDVCIGHLLATAEPDERTGCYPSLIDSAFSRSLAPSVIEYCIQGLHDAILASLLQAIFSWLKPAFPANERFLSASQSCPIPWVGSSASNLCQITVSGVHRQSKIRAGLSLEGQWR